MSGRGGDEVDWDFSFVDDELPQRPTHRGGRPAPDPSAGGEDMTWDFSFVGRGEDGSRPERPAHAPARPGEVDEVDWDFSFVDGERTGPRPAARSSASAPKPSAEESMDWDFSFVTADDREAPPVDPTPAHPLQEPLAPQPESPDPLPASDPALDAEPEWAVEPEPMAELEPMAGFEPVSEVAPAPDAGQGMSEPAEPDAGGVASSQPELDLALEPEPLLDPTPIAAPDPTFDFGAVESTTVMTRVDPSSATPDDNRAGPTDELPAPAAADSAPAPGPMGSAEVPVLDVAALEPVKILSICTHNRTRSVMMMGLLQDGFDKELGPDVVMVRSLGTGPEGEEPIADAVDQMAQRGIDVSDHRSLQITAPRVEPADLILTAERDHVVRIAELSPETFARTFTLPEFCRKVAADPTAGRRSLRQWMTSLSAGRSPAAYLADDVPEVDDPTGSPPRQFQASTLTIEAMCQTVVDLLAPAIQKALREAQRAATGRPG